MTAVPGAYESRRVARVTRLGLAVPRAINALARATVPARRLAWPPPLTLLHGGLWDPRVGLDLDVLATATGRASAASGDELGPARPTRFASDAAPGGAALRPGPPPYANLSHPRADPEGSGPDAAPGTAWPPRSGWPRVAAHAEAASAGSGGARVSTGPVRSLAPKPDPVAADLTGHPGLASERVVDDRATVRGERWPRSAATAITTSPAAAAPARGAPRTAPSPGVEAGLPTGWPFTEAPGDRVTPPGRSALDDLVRQWGEPAPEPHDDGGSLAVVSRAPESAAGPGTTRSGAAAPELDQLQATLNHQVRRWGEPAPEPHDDGGALVVVSRSPECAAGPRTTPSGAPVSPYLDELEVALDELLRREVERHGLDQEVW